MIHPIRLNLGIFIAWEKLRSNDVKRDNFQLYGYVSANILNKKNAVDMFSRTKSSQNECVTFILSPRAMWSV